MKRHISAKLMSQLAFSCNDAATKPEPSDRLKIATDDDGVTTIELASAPVNVLSAPFFKQFNDWLSWLHNDEATKAVIISSALTGIFTAGLDITEMIDASLDKFALTWHEVQRNWQITHTHKKPLIVLITGTCPGMGCVLTLGCDYRVMVRAAGPRAPAPNVDSSTAVPLTASPLRPFRYGLNEGSIGLIVPPYISKAYVASLGLLRGDNFLQSGRMLGADEAVALGLIDMAVQDKEEGMAAARLRANQLMKLDPHARYLQKCMVREPFVTLHTEQDRDADTCMFFDLISRPSVQETLKGFYAQLNSRRR